MLKYTNMKSMKERIYIATFGENAIQVAKENQLNIEVNQTCISYLLDDDNFAKTMADIKKDIEESGSKELIFHGPFTEIHPAAIDHRIVEAGRKRLEEAYSMVKAFSCKKMVVHTGYIPFIYIKSWQVEKSLQFWQDFMKDKPEDFNIYVENVLEDEPYTLAQMMEAMDDSRIKLCLDVGHANAMTKDVDIYEWVRVLGKYIGHFHIHNNYGDGDDHLTLGEGTIDYQRLFDLIQQCCYPGVTFTIESRQCQGSVDWLKEKGYI